MPRTLLAFHAHPDDEALLTSGTLARAAAEGHRVVLVVATDGDLGLASSSYAADGRLGERRLAELRASAQALGAARVEWLGYADSGLGPELEPDPSGRTRFVRAPLEEAAERLAAVLREESVDVLLTYDRNGGYGHRDHVRVHEVGERAAYLAGTPRVLQATVPRDSLARGLDLVKKVYRFPPEFDEAAFRRAFSARAEITHRISVRRYAGAKRASMRAHASQSSADGGADRTLAAFLRIPRPLFDVVFGREWFIDPARPAGLPVSRDVFEGLGWSAAESAPGPGARAHRSGVRRLLQAVLGLGLAVALLVWGLPYFGHTTWADIWEVLTRVRWTTAGVLIGGLVLGLYCYTFTLTGSMRGLKHWQALIVNVAGSAVGNLLPAGGAAGLAATYTICRSWGFSRRAISTSAIVTGVWNVMARVALPVVAILGLLAGSDPDVPRSLRDAAVGGALTGGLLLAAFVAVIASERAAVAIGHAVDLVVGRLFQRRTMTVQALVIDLRHRINDVVRRGWLGMTLGLVGYFGAYYVVFLLCMRATNVDLPYGQLFAAFAIGRLLTAVGVTPGGLGVTESATIIALVGWGAGNAEAAAGAVLFSVFTHFMEIPLGALGWLAWSASPKQAPAEDKGGDAPSGDGSALRAAGAGEG